MTLYSELKLNFIPLSPFIMTQILDPTHLSINSKRLRVSYWNETSQISDIPKGSSCDAMIEILDRKECTSYPGRKLS